MHNIAAGLLVLWVAGVCQGARGGRYALILEDPPLAVLEKAGAKERAARSASQGILTQKLRERGITVTGATATVLNAVYVAGISAEEAAGLRAMTGVARVVEMEPVKRHMVKAAELVNVSQAWSSIGGAGNAGTGVKIGILDTGIDQEHPAFQDAALRPPTGYPRCREADCSYTNSKVIVARSYVDLLVLGDQPQFSRPDDLSARDRVGHGTATAMVAAAARHESPLGAMSGIAQKAFLGNYKIFGSPGVNDVTFDDVIIRALDDAVNDGMDIVVMSLGRAALWAPDDRGTVCNLPSTTSCDPRAEAVENAVRRGVTVVISAGNDGDFGVHSPALNTVHSPGTAPSAITVGASTNSQRYYFSVRMTGEGVPQALRQIPALFGDGPRPGTVTAPMRDVAAMQDDGRACSPLANGSLAGAIALVQRGSCSFLTKVQNAQRAGAVGVVIQQLDGSDFLFPPTGLGGTAVPAMMIGGAGGKALQEFLRSNPDRPASMDASVITVAQDADLVAFFSSYGPSIGSGAIKPELVAVGQEIYTATQRFDPNGDMYHASGFTAVQGTSFSAPMVAGAAALFKQRFPNATPAQVKSAVVNTASNTVNDVDNSERVVRASVLAVGAGKLDAAGPARTTVTAEPAVLSLGILTAAPLPSRGFRVNNHGTAAVNVVLQVRPLRTDANARLVLSESSFSLAPGTSRQITARLEGTLSQPGVHEGDVLVSGGAVPLRLPFLYLVGDNATDNSIPLRGSDFVGEVNGTMRLALKLVDRFGVPVSRVPVRFRSTVGGGSIDTGTQSTDNLGIAEATVRLGPTLGEAEFSAEAGELTLYFPGRTMLAPVIQTDGVVNAASQQVGRGVAPGSYVSIFGRNLSESLRVASTASLPLSIAGVSVSFDVPELRLSLPGKLHFVSEGQINVQVPWELQGLNTVLMKVSIGDSSSALYDVPLNDYSPALFEYTDPATGRLLAAALDQAFRLVSPSNPVRRGQFVQLYANGLGPVNDRPATGEPSAAEPLARTRVLPTVTIGGRPAQVIFSGLAPGNVGLYQLNVQVPADAAAGIAPVVVTENNISSKSSSLPIE